MKVETPDKDCWNMYSNKRLVRHDFIYISSTQQHMRQERTRSYLLNVHKVEYTWNENAKQF